jgi:Stigma-specific protein, Stig1
MERLDELSKMLAASVSRRESLRTIGVVLAGAALSTLGINTAWAARPDRCTAFCRSCPTRTKRNQCMEACRACNGNTSRLCGSCGAYACCPSGAACCYGTCTDLNSNSNNCGACGNVCPESTPFCVAGACAAGTCTPSCPDGWCGGDGCGGECACPQGYFCQSNGSNLCAPGCDPDDPQCH